MAGAQTSLTERDDDPAHAPEAPLPDSLLAPPAAHDTIRALRDAAHRFIAASIADEDQAARAAAMAVPACVLWNQFLRFDPTNPDWPDRDRFVVSSTRHRPLLHAMMRLAGQTAAGEGVIEYGAHPAVEMAFGPSGQGLGAAIGLALAERQMATRFGRSIVNHRVWVLSCATELSTGVALETASLAARMALDRVTVLLEITPEDADDAADALARHVASGWSVRQVAADDSDAVHAALAAAMRSRKPCMVACTVRATPRRIPPRAPQGDLASLMWARVTRRGAAARRSWLRRVAKHRHRAEFERTIEGRLPSFWREDWIRSWQVAAGPLPSAMLHTATLRPAALRASRPRAGQPRPAGTAGGGATTDTTAAAGTTLAHGRQGLVVLRDLLPELLCLFSRRGGELTSPVWGPVWDDDPAADCGIRVHGLAALLNGVAAHGGLIPCGATTFVAIDRMRPALRFAALMRRQVIYLLTDDGLALGQDGAGWLPVEQLASLRAMPNVAVFRPADRRETMESWELALRRTDGPSLITLCPTAGEGADSAEPRGRRPRFGSARGGYVLDEPRAPRQVTLIATGSEVAIARQAQRALTHEGVHAALVSLPCWELFARQDAAYREQVLGQAPRIGIEAASAFGWERWLGPGGAFIGMEDFGETAPASELYRRLGITAERICDTAMRLIGETGRDFPSPSGQKAESGRAQPRPTARKG